MRPVLRKLVWHETLRTLEDVWLWMTIIAVFAGMCVLAVMQRSCR